ncbi:MAG: cell division protein ZapA [Lachnospiraceae bacterium]|nr:cell division protein ZapA [Lachnospiraceae bacterium]
MKRQNDTNVIICGRSYTISGFESEEYLQRVAAYINTKNEEFKRKNFYKLLDTETRNMLMQLNIADDYFKGQEQLERMKSESETRNQDIFSLKHEAIAAQNRIEALQKELEKVKNQNFESQKTIVRLETELAERNKE